MSRRKAFLLRIEIDIHSVDCPGLRICRSGNVVVRVHTLSSAAATKPGYPPFPIHIHETLTFEMVLECVSDLSEIQDYLNKEPLRAEIVYIPGHTEVESVVSEFRTKLSELIFPTSLNEDEVNGGRIRLLADSTDKYQRAHPRIEVSTKIAIDEVSSASSEILTVSIQHGHRESDRSKRGRSSRMDGSDVRWSRENCGICSKYSGYFGSEGYFGSCPSAKHWFTPEMGKAISYRQQFYENLEYFYRQLLNKRKAANH